MNPSARAALLDLSARRFDLLVVGGGATGTGIAREAAVRGLAVALVEAGDFAAGTSSRSSRLIHGGLRYLEYGRLGLVRESLTERAVLLRTAPHLVRPLQFVFPIFAGGRVPRWKLELGLSLYDVLALGGNVLRHRALSKRSLLELEAGVRPAGLTGGASYWDAQCDDARLAVATARAAARSGAVVANYMRVKQLTFADQRVSGAVVRDELAGDEAAIRARVVVSATGPWTDALRRLEDPAAAPVLAASRGSHVMVPRSRIGHRHAMTFLSPRDGRVMFVLPWGEHSYIGTTDTDSGDDPGSVAATDADIAYLLDSANGLFPDARLTDADVVSTWAGLRPLLADQAAGAGARSREHAVLTGPAGMVTIAGGKLTTYRRMALDLLRAIGPRLDLSPDRTAPGRTRTATEPLPGGEPFDRRQTGADLEAGGLPPDAAARLMDRYGSESAEFGRYLSGDRALGERIHPDHPALAAEVIHAVRHEFARRIDDVLGRRLGVMFETPDGGLAAATAVADRMAAELGWDAGTRAAELERYRAVVRAMPRGRALSSKSG